jgi:hypothetical protein
MSLYRRNPKNNKDTSKCSCLCDRGEFHYGAKKSDPISQMYALKRSLLVLHSKVLKYLDILVVVMKGLVMMQQKN